MRETDRPRQKWETRKIQGNEKLNKKLEPIGNTQTRFGHSIHLNFLDFTETSCVPKLH